MKQQNSNFLSVVIKYVLHHAQVLHLVASMYQCHWGYFCGGRPSRKHSFHLYLHLQLYLILHCTISTLCIEGGFFVGGTHRPSGKHSIHGTALAPLIQCQHKAILGRERDVPAQRESSLDVHTVLTVNTTHSWHTLHCIPMMAKWCMRPQQGCISSFLDLSTEGTIQTKMLPKTRCCETSNDNKLFIKPTKINRPFQEATNDATNAQLKSFLIFGWEHWTSCLSVDETYVR